MDKQRAPSISENLARIRRHAEEIRSDLGFTWDNLRGKSILDIGSGCGEFVQVAREFGIDAYGVDEIHPNDARKPEYLGYITNEGAKNDGLVVADAKHLPFRDSVFDYVCTHSSVPLYGDPSPEDIKAHVAEMLRVVKDGGEVRIHPFLKETGIWPFRNMNSKHRENQRKFLALFPNAEIRAEFAIVRK